MGQYFLICNLDAQKYVYPGNVLGTYYSVKFCGHTHIGCDVVRCVEALLAPGGEWHKDRIVWAGDYSAVEPGHYIRKNDEDEEGEPANLYQLCHTSTWATMQENLNTTLSDLRFVLNHDTNEYVDVVKAKRGTEYHPLALLTVDTSGSGGGDYDYEDDFEESLVGAWARARISVQDTRPVSEEFTELMTNDLCWRSVGHFILVRELVKQGRATFGESSHTNKALKQTLIHFEEGLYKKVLSFLLW